MKTLSWLTHLEREGDATRVHAARPGQPETWAAA
jgi:hypothetical protein